MRRITLSTMSRLCLTVVPTSVSTRRPEGAFGAGASGATGACGLSQAIRAIARVISNARDKGFLRGDEGDAGS